MSTRQKRSVFLVAVAVLFGAAAFFTSNPISADPITVNRPYHFRDNRSANSVGLRPGDFLTFGAYEVIPNGNNGTTGVATQGSVDVPLSFDPFSLLPNNFATGVTYNSNLTGQWNLKFTNGPDTTSVLTPSVGDAPMLPFASSVAISGSGLTPTFSWTLPSEFTPDGVRIQIWDLQSGPVGTSRLVDVIHAQNFQGNPGSFTVPSTFLSGKTLEQGHRYSFDISPALTRGGPLGDNATLLSRSRSFFDFEPLEPDAPPNVVLPIVTPGPIPVYSFHTTVVAGQTIFIDPPVAIGYDYAIGTGDPNFASVILPTGIGDNLFDLYLFNGTEWVFKTHLTGGNTYSFDPGGVDRFRIVGIEPSAGLDPQNPTAFITGLTFVNSGEFTGTMTPLPNFSMELYDDFSGTYIDKTKWRQGELVREIQNGRLILKQASPSPIVITSYPYSVSHWLNFLAPDSVNSIQADVTILESILTDSAQTRARLNVQCYNDGTPGGGSTGDIHAEIALRNEPTGLKANWFVLRFTNPNGTTYEVLNGGNFTTPISVGTTYTLFIGYDSVAHQFTFRIGSEEITFGPTGLPARAGNANTPLKALGTRILTNNATSSAYISATFDNVYKNGILYDDFSSSIIDETKWTTYEIVREISGGKLRSRTRSSSAYTSFVNNYLELLNPSSINAFQAKVTLVDYQNPQRLSERADLSGGFFNDGTPGGGLIGDVVGMVFIGGTGTDPVAAWRVYKTTDTAGNVATTVASGAFTTPITLGNTYTLLLGWDGSRFIFKFDDEVAHYTPVTAINPVNFPFKRVRTLITPGVDNKEATIEALFDDVMVGATCCPAIDVNPQSVEFGKVLPGGTSDQTVTVTNVGSVILTLGTIGSPSPPFSITGGTCTNNQTLPPQGICTLIIRFAPTGYGIYTSSFTIPSDDPVNSVVTVNPINGTSPDHFTLTISKSGTGNGTVTSSPAGINCGSDCTEDFKVGTKITLKAKADTNSTFTGWLGGGCSGTGTCVVIMNADIAVTAAFAAKTPDISVPSSSVDFGSVKSGKKTTKTLKITNNGSGNLVITLSGLEGTDFSIQGSSSVSIKAKKSYSLKVLCTPTSGGLKTATLEIDSNDADTPTLEISLTAVLPATTPDISVAQTPLDFGSVKVGKKVTKTLKIGNNGTGDLVITLSGLEETDFTIQGSSSVTIKAKKSYTLKVLFTPKSAGLETATLRVSSNDPDTPTLEISLTGTGQ